MSQDKRTFYAEVFGGPFPNAAQNLCDDEGRPISELSAPREVIARAEQQGVEFKIKKCPFPGIRQGKPMNASGLAQLNEHWVAMMHVLALLRDEHLRRERRAAMTTTDMWKVALVGQSLPAYVHRRATNQLGDRAIPGIIASVFKAAIGFTSTVQRAFLSHVARPSDPISPEVLHQCAEDQGLFLNPFVRPGEDIRACGGSKKMVVQILELMRDNRAAPAPTGFDVMPVIGDLDGLFEYASSVASIWVTFAMIVIQSFRILDRLRSDLTARDSPSARRIETAAKRYTSRIHRAIALMVECRDAGALAGGRFEADLGKASDRPATTRLFSDEPFVVDGEKAQGLADFFIPLVEGDSVVARRMAEALLDAVTMQREAVAVFRWAQRRAHRALGHAVELDDGEELRIGDLAQLFRVRVPDAIARMIGAKLDYRDDGVVLSAPGRTLTV